MEQMTFERYEILTGKLENSIKYYEKALSGNHFYLGLANGDKVNISFPENNIPHLLGVQPDALKSAGIVKMDMPSYEVLKQIINGRITYNFMRNSAFNINNLFSEYIDSKIDTFADNFRVKTDELYAIVKYRTDRSYTSGEEKENSDYFIIRKRKEKKDFIVLGIKKKNQYGNDYVPVTSRLFKNYSELAPFLSRVSKNQEVTYITTFRIENFCTEYQKDGFTVYENKQNYFDNLRDMAIKYGAIPSVLNDFSINIGKTLNNRQVNYNKTSILRLIREGMASGSVIDKEEAIEILGDVPMPTELDALIDACNDLICQRGINSENVGSSYSSIQNENIRLKEELKAVRDELLETQAANEQLEEEVTGLRDDNIKKEKKLGTLMDAYKSVMQEEE